MGDYTHIPIEEIFGDKNNICHTRIRNVLSGNSEPKWDRAPINTLGQLVSMKETEILKAPNLGRKSFNLIRDEVAKYGFKIVRGYGYGREFS